MVLLTRAYNAKEQFLVNSAAMIMTTVTAVTKAPTNKPTFVQATLADCVATPRITDFAVRIKQGRGVGVGAMLAYPLACTITTTMTMMIMMRRWWW